MRRTLPALLLTLALVACGDEPTAPAAAPPPPVAPAPPPAPPPPAPGTLEALLADWTPPAEIAEQVAKWESPGDVWPALQDLERAERALLIRAALRLPDAPVTRTAAQHADQRYLDRSERLRATRLICDGLALGQEVGPWNLIETASSADLRNEILPRLRVAPLTQLDDKELDVLHKFMRADDLPAICEWSLASGPPISTGLEFVIEGTAWHTTKHREHVARVILRGRDVPPDDGSGLPESLVAVLRLAFPAAGEDAVDIGRYDGWALQWLADEVPAAQDAELLARIADDAGHPIVLWSLRHVATDPSVRAALARRTEPAAYAALAAAGDRDALAHLRYAARADDVALAFLLLVDRAAALDQLFEQLVDRETTDSAVLGLRDILEKIRFAYCLDLGAADLEPLAERLLASECAPETLLACAAKIPALWSVECADVILARLDPVRLPAPDHYGDALFGWLELTLLELTRRDELVSLLRGWARGADEDSREFAIPLLTSLGDDASGDLIAEWFREQLDDEPWPQLGRVEHPDVRALLTDLAAGDDETGRAALGTLAELDGLPPHVYFPSEDLTTEELARVRELVFAGRAVDAFVLQYELDPDWYVDHAGDVDDPRVTAHLHERATRRGEDDYLSAMQELAAHGDAEARAMVLTAVRDGDYRWTEEIYPRAWMFENDAGGLAPWVDLAESNCCLNGGGKLFRTSGAPLGRWPDPGWSKHGHGDPPAARIRMWFAEWGPDLMRSDLLSSDGWPEYAPRPRDAPR